jgi:hypothetical protein
MKTLRRIACFAVAAVCLAFMQHVSSAEYTIDNLIEDTGVREGSVALRDNDVWDASRGIVFRNVGLDLPEFDNLNVVVVSSLDEALANALNSLQLRLMSAGYRFFPPALSTVSLQRNCRMAP